MPHVKSYSKDSNGILTFEELCLLSVFFVCLSPEQPLAVLCRCYSLPAGTQGTKILFTRKMKLSQHKKRTVKWCGDSKVTQLVLPKVFAIYAVCLGCLQMVESFKQSKFKGYLSYFNSQNR